MAVEEPFDALKAVGGDAEARPAGDEEAAAEALAEQDRLAARLWAGGSGARNWVCAALIGAV